MVTYTSSTAARGLCCCTTVVLTRMSAPPVGRGDGVRVVLQTEGSGGVMPLVWGRAELGKQAEPATHKV